MDSEHRKRDTISRLATIREYIQETENRVRKIAVAADSTGESADGDLSERECELRDALVEIEDHEEECDECEAMANIARKVLTKHGMI